MDKSLVNQFTSYVEQLRTTECSQKGKIAYFQHIAECIMSPALAGHINYATHINTATTVLLLFCEDLDPVVRMNAEENLNRIFRALEKTRVSRILMDLYGEIKRNGNQRSLRICLNLFAYYAPQIRERNIKWYAIRLLPCLQTIAQRKETQLCETLCEFVKSFGKCLQMGLTDSEACNLFEAFMANMGVECAVKRRCSAQNCISLIENSRNKSLMANHGLSKALEFLLSDQQQHNVLGVLGFLRLLLPLIIHGFRTDCPDDCDDGHHSPQTHVGINNKSKANSSNNNATQQRTTQIGGGVQQQAPTSTSSTAINTECRQIIEIFDYCLHLLNISSASQHSIINAALEVINAVLQALDVANNNSNNNSNSSRGGKNNKNNNNYDLVKSLQAALCNQQLQHAEYLRRRKSLKNQIFQLRNYEVSDAVPCEESAVAEAGAGVPKGRAAGMLGEKSEQKRGGAGDTLTTVADSEGEVVLRRAANFRYAGRSISECVVDEDDDDDETHRTALSTDLVAVAHTDAHVIAGDIYAGSVVGVLVDVDVDDDDFTTLSEINEPQQLRASTAVAMVPPSYALTTATIDVDNLIDAIDATTTTTTTTTTMTARTTTETIACSAATATSINSDGKHPNISAVHTKMQGMQPQKQQKQQQPQTEQQLLERQVRPQNLLTAPSQIEARSAEGGGSGSSGDDKSQHLSDIDNESFNSIDFEAEITIAGMGGTGSAGSGNGSPTVGNAAERIGAEAAAAVVDSAASTKLSSSSDTIGSFFNNLISNAASESMSKLFRPASGARATPTKSVQTPSSEKIDVASTTSAATSNALMDSISLISTASSGIKVQDLSNSASAEPQTDSAHTNTQSNASSSLGMHDDTVSTALLVDTSLHSAPELDAETDGKNEVEQRIPNVNPFLSANSLVQKVASLQPLLTLKIGTLFEQSIVRYTARLIAARFLLTGQAHGLHSDTQIRISIKSLSLSVLAQCVRFDPAVLQLRLEITEQEVQELHKQLTAATEFSSKSSSASGSPSMPQSDDSGSGNSSNLGKDYEHLDAVDFIKSNPLSIDAAAVVGVSDLPAELQLLEIKDDHFGKSTCEYLLESIPVLSKSADPVLMSQQVRDTTANRSAKQQPLQTLSKSEIIETKSKQQHRKPSQSSSSPYRVTESLQDVPPQMLPPRPPKRTKSQRKSIATAAATVAALMQIDEHISGRTLAPGPTATQHRQQIADVLLYYNHTDPMLRGGVQQIIGGFLQTLGAKQVAMRLELNVQHLLAMLVRGLQDDIHTVVIQALNAFERIFPYVVSKYLILPTAHHQHNQQHQQQQQKAQHKQQQVQQHIRALSSQSSTAVLVEAADKSGRKCHANASGQVPQQQHCTNDETNFGFSTTHASSKSPAMAQPAVAAATAASTTKTCPRTLFNDNDELIAALLNDFQLQSKSNRNDCSYSYDNDNNSYDTTQPLMTGITSNSSTTSRALPLPAAAAAAAGFRISPKLLLSKFRLCHYNKYWLVQNKYAEVISNLNYAALHAACNDCHGYCCGTTNDGCECAIGSVVAREEVGSAVGSGSSNDTNTDNNNLNACSNATKDAAAASASSDDAKDMSYNDDDSDDSVCIYETQFLDELLQLIGDDDFRVREHAALCLCRFIIQNAKRKQQQWHISNNNNTFSASTGGIGATTSTNKFGNRQHPDTGPFGAGIGGGGVGSGAAGGGASAVGDDKSLSPATYETNFNLLWDFFDYRLFSGLPLPLRNLFRAMSSPSLAATTATEVTTTTAAPTTLDASGGDFSDALPQRHRAEEEKLLAKVLYRMTNKLMELEDKNAQFGIIYALKMLLQDFNFIDYQRAWMEFNFIEICQRFSYYNYATAVDLSCQNDLIDVTGKLMAGYMLASTLTADQPERTLQLQLDQLLVHVMKILNIYYHLITQQKPLLFVKVQKGDLFANAKELTLVQSVGYFGSDYVYIKLYNILRSANDSYKITINQESGRLLISLLRTCLNTLSLCIELRTHAALVMPSTTPTGHTPSHGRQRGNSPSSSGGAAGGGAGSGGGTDTSPSTGHAFGVSGGVSASAVFPSNAILKLIEEILQYLSKLVNYAPAECIACLRQLLKYLFGQNYGNQQPDYYATFIRPYFVVRSKGQQLQLHLRQQRSLHKQQKWWAHSKKQHLDAQQGTLGSGTQGGGSSDHRQAITMLHAINSNATTMHATLATMTAATIGGSAAVLRGAGAGDGMSTPTMTSSTVTQNEPNVIGTQTTYGKRGQALIDFGLDNGGGDNNPLHLTAAEYYRLVGELFASGLNLQAYKSERASECVKHIKLFEPLVIYCLMLFLKSNARIQAPILELLSQLLELNVTYSVLDSKNVIFDQILNNLDLIENGIVRNGPLIIPPMIKFLIQLTHKSDRKLITIPKIISIINSLLANNAVLDCAVLALKSLSYEIFFMPPVGGNAALTTLADYRAPFQSPVTRSPVQQRRPAAEETAAAAAAAEALLANSRELDTQKEVVLGMLEKFLDANELQRVVALLLLRERSAQQIYGGKRVEAADAEMEPPKVSCTFESTLLQDPNVVYALICRAMCDDRWRVNNWQEFYILESCFKNYSKYVLADSKNFLMLMELFLMEDVENFSTLAHATIILANVILKTEEIYLVNHIKLYLKNHPAVEERELNRVQQQQLQRQQQQQQRTAHWLVDGPSTSSAAARATATATAAASSSGQASSGSISEINYFAKVLCEKLENCLNVVSAPTTSTSCNTTTNIITSACGDVAYYQLASRFVEALYDVCCRSRHKDALQSVFRLVLAESALLDKYCNFLTVEPWQKGDEVRHADNTTTTGQECVLGGGSGEQAMQLQLLVLKLLSAMKLLDPVVMLQLLKQQMQNVNQEQQRRYAAATNKERLKWCANMQRTLLSEICQPNPNARDWTTQQVRQLLDAGGAEVVNFLITENFEFVSDLCEVAATEADASSSTQAPEKVAGKLGAFWLNALLQHANALNKHTIRALPPLLLRLANATVSAGATRGCNLELTLLSLQLLHCLHTRHGNLRALQVRLERLARRLVFNCSSSSPLNSRQQLLKHLSELAGDQLATEAESSSTFWRQLLLDTQECKLDAQTVAEQQRQQQRIIDEKWLLSQLIKFSAQSDYGAQQLSRILLEIHSEQKLYMIFNSSEFAVARVLRHAIASSMQAMLAAFRNNCTQHNPHIHYMQPNPLVRVTCNILMASISAEIAADSRGKLQATLMVPTIVIPASTTASLEGPTIETEWRTASIGGLHLCHAVITLLTQIKLIEDTALLYIESKFIDKFVRDQLLRPEHVATLLRFLDWCCRQAQQLLKQQQHQHHHHSEQQNAVTLLQCIAAMLQQRFIWMELNQMEKSTAASAATTMPAQNSGFAGGLLSPQQRNLLLCRALDVLVLAARQTLQHTIFYKHYKQQAAAVVGKGGSDGEEHRAVETQDIFNTLGVAAAVDELEDTLQANNEIEANEVAVGRLLQAYAPQAIFIAKLIEVRTDESTSSGESISAAYLTGGTDKNGALGTAGGALSGGAGSSLATGGTGTSGGGAWTGAQAEFEKYSGGVNGVQVPMHILVAIGIALLRTNQFYAYAVTPFEIIQQQQREQRIEQLSPTKRAGQSSPTTASAAAAAAASSGKLPTIPVESLSDVDVLRKFVKRLSIFGFTTRQQFEEYFMTFLLLINKVYDENMVDEQEQFQIRSTCFEAILELLITYKTFPIVGNKLSHFHHTTRWTRINCDSISLKKLHKVQLLVSEANVFYHPNLERQLRTNYGANSNSNAAARVRDSVIGTGQFSVNQYDLNFVWQQMEAYANNTTNNNASDAEMPGSDVSSAAERKAKDSAGGAARSSEDIATKNYRYFTTQSGVDFKSSTQLIFDVLMQIIEHNHILVLPNLVKFTEICESRDQIKWIKEKALKLQETIPMDDTISHQHLIYLLCKTQAMLIPTLGELQQLCQLIGNYLKSSHIFIRNATLAGLLCLLECCSKTNTTIGKLSEELALLRELIVGYINRHGIIDVSAMQCSDTHTKLVWTLNYCLIEWTSKFVPQCHLLSNTVIAAGNFLRKSSNEDVYLCVLHGLERIVVISNVSHTSGGPAVNTATGISGIVTPVLRNKIEKLALELVKLENERFSIPALQLLLSCMYVGSAKQLENTELSNGIVQDEPEIIAQQTDKVDILLHCIKSSTRDAAWIYGQVLCQIIRDLVPPNEILTKVIKEFLAINQPHCDVIAMIVYQVFRCAIDSTFLQMLQDWLICSLPTFLALPEQKGVWCLSVIFLSASINLHLIKLFPVLLSTGAAAVAAAAAAADSSTATGGIIGRCDVGDAGDEVDGGAGVIGGASHKLGQHEIALFVTAAVDFHAKLSAEQRMRFRDAFEKFHKQPVYAKLLQSI
ncbi:uncharacterized protein LOC118736962 isoform X2 [Rhagoletis pomonella]|uniref:uncharacterized protein LOC118736962 isoform X2 n=1 Tax=Rhagoletis pomonella TaxID=28610 RepID=UPI00178073BE|nr:uncharacterized protein LOC118736962 isoform X2 [Rhagoletis pomonella]